MKTKLDIKVKVTNILDMKKVLDKIKEIVKNHPEITEVNIEVVI